MITILKYTGEMKRDWDDFCAQSKNSLFMFKRSYMDYHKDRFEDHSLLFYRDDVLIALLPMNIIGNTLYSHGGLTYGGFITGKKMKQHTMLECFCALIHYCKSLGIEKIFYKLIPHIYHLQPAEEDRYALFLQNAKLMRVEASTVVNMQNSYKMEKRSKVNKAKKAGVEVQKLTDKESFYAFIDLENEVLDEHHNVKAVHTGEELYTLYQAFPQNIHLFAAIFDGEMVAGTVIFEYDTVIHTQYMAANDDARAMGALDCVIATVMEKYSESKYWMDFGISTEDAGKYLNKGLIYQKEGFGGRTNVYEMWEIDVKDCEEFDE